MNNTITNINDNTMDFEVRKNTKFLIANKGKTFKAVFEKVDGTIREMIFTIATNWNAMNGLETTWSGKKMVSTKCRKNMATVCEKLDNGVFQPRTLNLASIRSLEIL